jgi:hypothetical protein
MELKMFLKKENENLPKKKVIGLFRVKFSMMN